MRIVRFTGPGTMGRHIARHLIEASLELVAFGKDVWCPACGREPRGSTCGVRPHRALELKVPREAERPRPPPKGRIIRSHILGGLTHEYEREAA